LSSSFLQTKTRKITFYCTQKFNFALRSVLVCVGLCGSASVCVGLCRSVLACVVLCWSVSVCVGLCCSVSVCVGLCLSVLVYVGLCWSVLVCVSLCHSVSVCVGLCRYVPVCVGLCGSVLVCVCLCQSVWAPQTNRLRTNATASRYENIFSIKQQKTYKGWSSMLAVELQDDNLSPINQVSICYIGHRIWDGFFLKTSTGGIILKWILGRWHRRSCTGCVAYKRGCW
jgi:hypothetical protein